MNIEDHDKKTETSEIQQKARYYLGLGFSYDYLSQREAQCTALLLKGHSDIEIGAILNISPRTVEFYFSNIRVKLMCKSKTEIIKKIKKSRFMKILNDVEQTIPSLELKN